MFSLRNKKNYLLIILKIHLIWSSMAYNLFGTMVGLPTKVESWYAHSTETEL